MEEECINESTRILKEENIKFKYVITFIIGNKGNLSVGAPQRLSKYYLFN